MQSLKSSILPALLTACVTCAAGSAYAGSSPFAGLQLNGNATLTPDGTLSLVTGLEQDSSAYTMTPLTLSPTFSFTSSFSVDLTKIKHVKGRADGFAFVVQNDPAGAKALGENGACLGVCDIKNYAAIAFQTYIHDFAGLLENGTYTRVPYRTGSRNEVIDVTVSYSQASTTMMFSAYNENTGKTVSESYTVDLTTLGPSVYVGFSGASGAVASNETVTNWSFSYTP